MNGKYSFILFLMLWTALPFFCGCSDDDGGGQEDGDADTNDSDEETSDGDTDTNDGDIEMPTEFSFRVPNQNAYLCKDPNMGDVEMADLDHLCLIQYEELDFELYVQSTPTSCSSDFWPMPIYSSKAWIKSNDAVSKLESVYYNHGGNHHNDWIEFALEGRNYQLWHSSIGSGWRRCAPVDCMLVCKNGTACSMDGETSAIELDGCEREAGSGKPPIPVICMEIPADGSRPDFLDPWQPLEGDEFYPLLPCNGEEDFI